MELGGMKAEVITDGLLLLHLVVAAILGLVLGYERTYQGRAAGVRTYSLVCVGATMLTMIFGTGESWFNAQQGATQDVARVIQGIVTGIGFLGAGVIMKEGFTIRGLSTAASIWVTAAIGVAIGVGFYGTAVFSTCLVLIIMEGFRKVEKFMPHHTLLHLRLVYERDKAPDPTEVRGRMMAYGYEVKDWTYSVQDEGKHFAYELILLASHDVSADSLVKNLTQSGSLIEFNLSPTRE